MEGNLRRLRWRLEREQKNYFEPADKALLAAVVRRALALPNEQRIASMDRAFAGKEAATVIDQLYASTRLFDPAEREKMLGESPEQLRARHDPLVDLGFDLANDVRETTERTDRWT